MARLDHQPTEGIVEKTQHTKEELHDACGKLVAFVLSLDTGTMPLLVQFEDPDCERVVCEPAEDEPHGPRPLQIYEGKPCVAWAAQTAGLWG